MKKIKEKEIKGIYGIALLLFLIFLFVPVIVLFQQSLAGESGLSLAHYSEMLTQRGFVLAVLLHLEILFIFS